MELAPFFVSLPTGRHQIGAGQHVWATPYSFALEVRDLFPTISFIFGPVNTLSPVNAQHPLLKWLYRYRLYHLPFWFAYHYSWWTISVGDPFAAANNIFFSPYSFKFLFYVLFQAAGVYFNLYVLIPRLLERGKYGLYVLALLLTIFLTAMLIIPGYYLSAWWNEIPFEELFGRPPSDFFHFVKSNSLPSTAASMTLAMSIKLTKNWLQSQRHAQELEKEKLETELKFLKSQFNPHFLFNTINSIFVLIHKNPDQASESLAKFSQLLRYQLYDCNAPQIPLRQEITYLENFVELEKLRQEAHLEVDLQIEQGMNPALMIAPFILMPFVENAFKHVRPDTDSNSWIRIKLAVQDEHLHFKVANSSTLLPETTVEPDGYQGLGLKNVQRRLDLLYGGHHRLDILPASHQYIVSLQLDLARHSVSPPVLTPAS